MAASYPMESKRSQTEKQKYYQLWYNGSQFNFISQPDESLLCKQCGHLAYEPHLCCCCSSIFCKTCTFPSTCPVCNELSENVFDYQSNKLIRKLIVGCPNSLSLPKFNRLECTCHWKGELREVSNHRMECELEWVPCSYSIVGCEEKMYRYMMVKHEKKSREIHLNLTMRKVVSLTVAVEELQKRVKQLDVLQERVKQPFHTESGLRGVDVHGKTSLTITNTAQQYVWKKFGLKLTIPSGALPPGVDRCELVIKASISGNYQLPKNYHLVSPIFWIHCEPHRKSFAKVVTLELQHCALDQNLPKLSFVKALCTQKELPYSFQVLSGGKFSLSSSYGLVELNSFSGIGVAQI